MKKISVKAIRKFKPCYDPTEIEGITEDTSMLLLDWLRLDIPAKDKVWLATRKGFMTKAQHREFAIWCAEQCKTQRKEIKDFLRVIKEHYAGKATREELEAAYGAAYRAAN